MRKWLHCVGNSTCNPASPHCICGSPGCHFHTHFTPSPVGVIISNHELICISIVVGGNTSRCSPGRTPFGSPSHKQYKPTRVQGGISMPSKLLSRSSPPLSQQEVYTLQACSLLVIPPPIGREIPQGGFLVDLAEINLWGWAFLVQDIAGSLQALPPELSHGLSPHVVALLQLLEAATGVGFCHHCCHPIPHCRCVGAPQLAPSMSWSQVMEQTLGYGVTPSSGGVTTLSTSQGGMSGYMPPPPGITTWGTPPLEDAIPPGPVAILPYRPPAGAGRLRCVMGMRGIVPQAPQMPTPIRQPPLFPQSRQATPYQQQVQLLSKTSGLGVTFDSSATKPAPTRSEDTDVCGRPATQGRDDGHRPASRTRGGRERSSIRKTDMLTPHQGGGCPAGASHNPPPTLHLRL